MDNELTPEEIDQLRTLARRVPDLVEFLDERRAWRQVRGAMLATCKGMITVGGVIVLLASGGAWLAEWLSAQGGK